MENIFSQMNGLEAADVDLSKLVVAGSLLSNYKGLPIKSPEAFWQIVEARVASVIPKGEPSIKTEVNQN